ncbi:ELM1/GtrOC1 family putative glycosyltransferase [Sessilibacter sp. MAH4]
MTTNNTLKILRIVDGKPGHEKQSHALIEGLKKFRAIEVIDAHYVKTTAALKAIAFSTDIFNIDFIPDICIGVGHRTHLSVLAAKNKWHAKAVIIMNPSLPLACFDAVLTPAHDGYTESAKRIITPIALAPESGEVTKPYSPNNSSFKNRPFGLILLGGINQHYEWHIESLSATIKKIVNHYDTIQWKIANSRRTPVTDFDYLQKSLRGFSNINFFDHHDLDKQWLAEQLNQTQHIWVTADSASMIAEALNTRAFVGIIGLTSKSLKNKLEKSNQSLLSLNLVGQVNQQEFKEPPKRDKPLNPHIEAAQKLIQLLKL